MAKASAEQRRHWGRVADLQCLLTDMPATIAHCHGGSIIDTLGYSANPGMGQRQNHWLVIPLCREMHQGQDGLDTCSDGPRGWESRHGKQIILLEWVSHLLGYNVIERAGHGSYEFQTDRAWCHPEEPEPDAG